MPSSSAEAKRTAAARTKASGTVLKASKQMVQLAERRKALQSNLDQLRKEKKRAAREARKLKAKASKIDLGELLQMMMMKAYVLSEEQTAASGSSASSSTAPWKPSTPKEAFEKIQEALTGQEQQEVQSFANNLGNQEKEADE